MQSSSLPAALLCSGIALATTVLGCGGEQSVGPGHGDPDLAVVVEAGADARAPAGTPLTEGPVVVVQDGAGDPVPGVAVEFRVVAGGGRVDPRTDTTDASGRAGTVWILGPETEVPQSVEASTDAASVRISATAVEPMPGESYEGREGRTVWLAGDLPLILSAPHGGYRKPSEIPDRTWGSRVHDTRTLEMALRIREAVHRATGGWPHLVYNDLHRTKLDPNREILEAAQGHPRAERAWHEYHAFLEAAADRVEDAHGSGLLLDVHAHSHEHRRVELGYLLRPIDLERSDSALAASGSAAKSSIRELAARSPESFPALLRGETSLGGLLEARDVPVVPGPANPDPGEFAYWTGGYITRRHGSLDGGTVSAIQLEHPVEGILKTETERVEYAETLTDALSSFFPVHFGRTLAAPPRAAAAPRAR